MRTIAALALIAGAMATGCGIHEHSLAEPREPASPDRECTIGVAPILGTHTLDYALELRDRLRKSGPCKNVVATSESDQRPDLVVTGKLSNDVGPYGYRGSDVAIIVVGSFLGIGGLMMPPVLAVLGVLEWGVAVPIMIGAGAFTVGLGFYMFRPQQPIMEGTVTGDFRVLKGGREIASWKIADTVRLQEDAGKRADPRLGDSFLPVLRASTGRVFDTLGARLGGLVETGSRTSRSRDDSDDD